MALFRLFLGAQQAAPPSGNVTVYLAGVAAGAALGTALYVQPPVGWDSTINYFGKITFTDNNKIATAAANAGSNELWSVVTHNNGKYFAEVKFNGGVAPAVGLLSPIFNGPYITQNGDVYVSRAAGTTPYVGLFPPLVQGDVIGMAVDIDAGKAWFRVNGGPWNNDPAQGPA